MAELEWFGKHVALIDPETYHNHTYEDAVNASMRMLAAMPDDVGMQPMGHYWSNGSLVAQITATGRGVMASNLGDEMLAQVAAFSDDDPDKTRIFIDVAMLYWPFIAANEQVDEMLIVLDANVRYGGGRFTETLIFNHLLPGSTEITMRAYRRDDDGMIVEWDDPVTGIKGGMGGRMGSMAQSVTEVRLRYEQTEKNELEVIIAGLIGERAAQVMLPKELPWTELTEHFK